MEGQSRVAEKKQKRFQKKQDIYCDNRRLHFDHGDALGAL